MKETNLNRRPINSRNSRWAIWLAVKIAKLGITPNAISLCSILFAIITMLCLMFAFKLPSHLCTLFALLVAIIGILARLLCNLIDGMVAIEGRLGSPSGILYNEIPDRISDVVIYFGLGYGLFEYSFAIYLGGLVGLFSVMTAYVRLLGGSCGLVQKFSGPFAKQQRMIVIIIGCLLAMCIADYGQIILYIALWIAMIGTFVTIVRRVYDIHHDLNKAANKSKYNDCV